ncbi:MAG TPA: zinc ribbon domain-containing protein [Thermoplasmata archaeon]|nr:zinc ribbon domain-containing protein [Thermoplasmata archaeon]
MASSGCARCGSPLAADSAFCTQCGTRVAPGTPPTGTGGPLPPSPDPIPMSNSAPTPAPLPQRSRLCVNCQSQMASVGMLSFRTGGWTGGAGPHTGGWNAATESLHPFSLYYCAKCGKFDLYYAGT